jgi:hypothetical protein
VVELDRKAPEYFDNTGIRKAILLTRYAALLKNWMADERSHAHLSYPWNPAIDDHSGITIPNEALFSQWDALAALRPLHRIFPALARYLRTRPGYRRHELNQEPPSPARE